MDAKARLDSLWWKKNRPDALSVSAVQKPLDELAKVSRSLEKSGNVAAYFKAVSKLKSAISKDMQTVRKAKDREGLKLLSELERLAHHQAKSKQGQLTLKSELATTGLSGTAGTKVTEVSPGENLTQLVNGRDRNWKLISRNQIVSAAKSKSCQAVPKALSGRDLKAWSTESVSWSAAIRNEENTPVVSAKLQLRYQWGGHAPQGGGAFLTDCGLWVTDFRASWGYSVDADLEVGKPYNAGTHKAPIGAIPLRITMLIASSLDKKTESWLIHCHGNKKREVK